MKSFRELLDEAKKPSGTVIRVTKAKISEKDHKWLKDSFAKIKENKKAKKPADKQLRKNIVAKLDKYKLTFSTYEAFIKEGGIPAKIKKTSKHAKDSRDYDKEVSDYYDNLP